MPKLKPRPMGSPSLLRSIAEVEAEQAQRLEEFKAWFFTIPGAEFEIASFDGTLLYCRWTAVVEHPEWGKVFCCYHIDRPLEEFRAVVQQADPPPPIGWDHWSYLGLDPSSPREAVIARFHEPSKATNEKERRWLHVAYVRAISDCWFRDYDRRARKAIAKETVRTQTDSEEKP